MYPVIIEPDGDGWMASFPDIPEALTGGDTREDALINARDALVTAFEFYFEDARPVPLPSVIEGAELVAVPLSVWGKVLLLNAMLEQRLPQAELARRMGTRKQDVQRLVDLRHPTKIDTLAQAMAAMGKQLVLSASAIPGRTP